MQISWSGDDGDQLVSVLAINCCCCSCCSCTREKISLECISRNRKSWFRFTLDRIHFNFSLFWSDLSGNQKYGAVSNFKLNKILANSTQVANGGSVDGSRLIRAEREKRVIETDSLKTRASRAAKQMAFCRNEQFTSLTFRLNFSNGISVRCCRSKSKSKPFRWSSNPSKFSAPKTNFSFQIFVSARGFSRLVDNPGFLFLFTLMCFCWSTRCSSHGSTSTNRMSSGLFSANSY